MIFFIVVYICGQNEMKAETLGHLGSNHVREG